MDTGSDLDGQAQNGISPEQGGQTNDQSLARIPEAQKPIYSKDDLEQILAETLRIAIDIVRAKKQYVPQTSSTSSNQQYQYQRPAYNGGGGTTPWSQRPPNGPPQYGSSYGRAPTSYYR